MTSLPCIGVARVTTRINWPVPAVVVGATHGNLIKIELLGWQAQTAFADLVRIMLAADLAERGLDPDVLVRDPHSTTSG